MTPVKASLVRVWEPEAPEGIEPLEWILVTSVAVNTAEDAWQRVTWYKWRWLSEDFHKVLKTGCLLEDRCLQRVEAMCNLLAILTPTAMRLLWLRQTAQTAPDTPASQVISQEVIQVVLHLDKRPKAQYCELKQRWEAPLVPGEEMGPADQPFGQNPQSVALAQRVRAVADGAS